MLNHLRSLAALLPHTTALHVSIRIADYFHAVTSSSFHSSVWLPPAAASIISSRLLNLPGDVATSPATDQASYGRQAVVMLMIITREEFEESVCTGHEACEHGSRQPRSYDPILRRQPSAATLQASFASYQPAGTPAGRARLLSSGPHRFETSSTLRTVRTMMMVVINASSRGRTGRLILLSCTVALCSVLLQAPTADAFVETRLSIAGTQQRVSLISPNNAGAADR